jgi:NAD(P)-dependent dehydrogenase (short-subunit alcohol dehydrogenase family)
MAVAVVGSAGRLGQALVQTLLQRGYAPVVCIDCLPQPQLPRGACIPLQVDITNASATAEALRGAPLPSPVQPPWSSCDPRSPLDSVALALISLALISLAFGLLQACAWSSTRPP